MNKEVQQKALIYCRVSDSKQKREGHGLNSQEHRCRKYAETHDYAVEAVFPDDASGGGDFMKRPGMVSMLRYLDQRPHESYVVVFDDLKRFARDTIFHFMLKQELAARNARIECLNFNFEDTPEGEFVETVIAAQGQLERLQNRRQTLQKMKARVEQGYYVFQAPVGYEYRKTAGQGKMLFRNEPVASILKEALEGYASGRFQMQVEVKRFLEAHPQIPKTSNGGMRNQQVTDILTRPVYAGYVEAPSWGITLRKGNHEPLISLETFEKIQARLKGNAKTAARKDISAEFPLRGFVLCGDCNKPLTACWSSGKRQKYPYYLCHTKGCESYRKSIPRDRLEGEFEELLTRMQPTENLFSMARIMFRDIWDHRLSQVQDMARALGQEVAGVERQIEQLLDRIVEATNPRVISAYEKRLAKLERDKLVAHERLENCGQPKKPFEEMFEHAMRFLEHPLSAWNSSFIMKRTLLKLAFIDRLAYDRNKGFRTPEIALPFKVLGDFNGGNCKMARPRGIEPLFPG